MQITQHIYRMPLLRSIALVTIGVFFTACSLVLILLLPELWGSLTESKNLGGQVFTVAIFLIFVLFFLFIGIALILHPIYTRLNITSAGLEYQTFAGSLKSAWPDVYEQEVPPSTVQPLSMVLASTKPIVRLRGWTRFVPWNVGKGFISNGISLTLFGKLQGSPLEADLYTFAPQLKEDLQKEKLEAYQPQSKAKKTTIKTLLVYAWFLLLIFLFEFVVGGQSEKLGCNRSSRGEPVDCEIKRSWYWTIPLGTAVARNVQGAKLMEYRNGEDLAYQIVLQTAAGDLPLTWMPMGGKGMGDRIAQDIDEFVKDPSRANYEQRIGPREAAGRIFAWLLAIMILSGSWLFWPKTKTLVADHV